MSRIFSARFFYVIIVSVINMSGKQRKYSFEKKLKYVKAERDILKKTLEILKKQQKV